MTLWPGLRHQLVEGLTPERPGTDAVQALVYVLKTACQLDDESLEELEMGDIGSPANDLRLFAECPGPDRPGCQTLAEMAEACVEEVEALNYAENVSRRSVYRWKR